ncbi:MAG: VWA domain-containing protein [Planctomycetia bacterium]|nr:VWA domain-containing protein [Planctomycetia bacterium]
MTFFLEQPFWSILILAWLPIFWYWRKRLGKETLWHSGLILVLRCVVVLFLVVAMVSPVCTWKNLARYVVCAMDVSGSIRTSDTFWNLEDASQFPEVDTSRGDVRVYVPYARTMGVRQTRAEAILEASPDPSATDLSAVLAASVAMTPEDYVPEVVLYTDGTYNRGLEPRWMGNVPLRVVRHAPAGANGKAETWIERIEAPTSAFSGEVVAVEAFFQATEAVGEWNAELLRNGESVETQTVVFEEAGVRGVCFQATAKPKSEESLVEWEVVLHLRAEQNQMTENDRLTMVTQIVPPRRILLVERSPQLGARLADVLKKEFLEVQSCLPEEVPQNLEGLKAYDLLILANTPVSRIPVGVLKAIEAYVTQWGGGLLVVGGNQSFTAGGYHATPMERILPVICLEEGKTQREGLGLVLVVDRSESMKRGNAIELAREAVKRALDVLGPQDQVGVLVFADTSGWVVPICSLTQENKKQAFENIDKIRAVSVTNMGPALEKAFRALQEMSAVRKHLIVMTDGISNPDHFGALAEKFHQAGVTLSTIALGNEAEPNVLADMATIGKGKAYRCTDPESLPQIFTAETASAAQIGVVEGQTPVRQISSLPAFLHFDFTQVPPLLGYVQTRAKIGSRTIFETASGSPLLCWWNCGRGKVVAFTSGVESHWMETWSTGWKDFGRFWGRLVNHAIRKETDGFQVRLAFQGDGMNVLLQVPSGKELAENPQWTLEGESRSLKPVAPGVYADRILVESGKRYPVAISAGEFTWQGIAVPPFSEEYRPDRQKNAMPALERMVEETNQNPVTYVSQTLPFWSFFVFLAMVTWLVEIGFRRA